MAYDRRSFAGGAVATTLTAGIDGSTLTIPIAASTGWPTGSAGDFYIVIGRGTATEEKVRIDTRTTLTLTAIAGGRGVDGTSAVAHSTGAAVEVCLAAVDLDEANAHIADTALDHHTQYLSTGRHDIAGRHAFGAAYGTPAAAVSIGTANATGSGASPAREDHVHKIGTGAINTAGMFAAGVVDAAAIGAGAVGTAKIAALAVGTAELAAGAVTAVKITDATITQAKLVATLLPIVPCTAATRPGFPVEGQQIHETDTDLRLFYTGAAWLYLPGQTLGTFAQVTADQTGIGTNTDLTGLAVTFDALGGPIRMCGALKIVHGTSADEIAVVIREGATQIQEVIRCSLGAGESLNVPFVKRTTPASGSHTYKVTVTQAGGTTSLGATATNAAQFWIESA